jgi:hypothetical protein
VADCCSYAASGKNYLCDKSGGGAHGVCNLEQPFQKCSASADCAGSYPCRNGYCHYLDGSQSDGWSCLDGQECASGICAGASTATTPITQGVCCSGGGTSCVAGSGATSCCAPLACTGTSGAQTCAACLDPENSGTGHPFQCTTYSQCCQNAGLGCETATGTCCKLNGTGCTAGSECCSGETCGNVTTYQGTAANVCCGAFQGWCGGGSPCCDGLVCSNAGAGYPATCLGAPGYPCQSNADCTDSAGCKIVAPATTGTCCLHDMGTCAQDSDCCSGICDPTMHICQSAPPYGQCLVKGDCQSMLNTSYTGELCGANPSVGALHCCPAPGQACASAADCCEAGDRCQPEVSIDPLASQTTSPVCCRGIQQSCAQDFECCTGVCGYRGAPGSFCCAYPYMTTFACTSNADCCGGTDTVPSTQCQSNRCCFTAGQQNVTDPTQCCSGRTKLNVCQ